MPVTLTHTPRQNRILASLSADEYSRLADDLELVKMGHGQILYESGAAEDFVYFPTTCIISLLFTTENGSSAQLAMTGSDGLVGIPLVLGGNTTTHQVVTQSDGHAYRLRAEILRWEFDQGGTLQRLCLCYSQALMTQMGQSIVCNRYHSVDQRLCRWLLLSLDQLPSSALCITQEQIANILGVRREGITEAAGNLQAAGLIQYHRGNITVMDRIGLEARGCECYRAVKTEYERLFDLVPASPPRQRARANPATLRKRAEARLALKRETQAAWPSAQWDTERLVHELQVHQIELEMHNEELSLAYEEADLLRARYADIYDFAPVAYFTLNAQGVIFQLNLAGAILLGIKRSHNGRYRFAASVRDDCLPVFNRFLSEVLSGNNKKQCDLVLLPTGQRPERTVRVEAIADENGLECRMVVMDLDARCRVAVA